MTLGRPCPVVPLGAGERSSVGGRRRVGAAHPPAAGLCPAAGLFFGPGPKAPARKTPPPPRPTGRTAWGPRSFRTLRVQPPPPLRQSFLQRQKGKGKARPHDLWGLAHETLSGRGTATTPPLGQSPGPRYPGPGGFIRTAAGYNPLTTSPACARRSPWAQHRGD